MIFTLYNFTWEDGNINNDVFQFDFNFTLLLFHSFLHLSLCFIDRRSTPHNISSFIKISFRKGIFFTKKSIVFSLHTTSARKKGAYCKHISVSVFAFVSIGLKRETCDFFNLLLTSFSWTYFAREVMAHVCLEDLV